MAGKLVLLYEALLANGDINNRCAGNTIERDPDGPLTATKHHRTMSLSNNPRNHLQPPQHPHTIYPLHPKPRQILITPQILLH
jgi:hypothetical protein